MNELNLESRSVFNKYVNVDNRPGMSKNQVEFEYRAEGEMTELEIQAAAEIATTLKYESNISKEDFVKRKQGKLLTEPDITYIFRVQRIGSKRTFLGVIQKPKDDYFNI